MEEAEQVLRDHEAMKVLRAGKVTSLVFEARNAFSADEPRRLHGPKWHAEAPVSRSAGLVIRYENSSDDPSVAILATVIKEK